MTKPKSHIRHYTFTVRVPCEREVDEGAIIKVGKEYDVPVEKLIDAMRKAGGGKRDGKGKTRHE